MTSDDPRLQVDRYLIRRSDGMLGRIVSKGGSNEGGAWDIKMEDGSLILFASVNQLWLEFRPPDTD